MFHNSKCNNCLNWRHSHYGCQWPGASWEFVPYARPLGISWAPSSKVEMQFMVLSVSYQSGRTPPTPNPKNAEKLPWPSNVLLGMLHAHCLHPNASTCSSLRSTFWALFWVGHRPSTAISSVSWEPPNLSTSLCSHRTLVTTSVCIWIQDTFLRICKSTRMQTHLADSLCHKHRLNQTLSLHHLLLLNPSKSGTGEIPTCRKFCIMWKSDGCLLVINISCRQPWKWLSRPLMRLLMDFAGPFQDEMILVDIDSHSKWIEAYPIPPLTLQLQAK